MEVSPLHLPICLPRKPLKSTASTECSFIWKVFAVYSTEKTRVAAVEGGYHHCQKSCMTCKYCYRHESKGLSVIAELLK